MLPGFFLNTALTPSFSSGVLLTQAPGTNDEPPIAVRKKDRVPEPDCGRTASIFLVFALGFEPGT